MDVKPLFGSVGKVTTGDILIPCSLYTIYVHKTETRVKNNQGFSAIKSCAKYTT